MNGFHSPNPGQGWGEQEPDAGRVKTLSCLTPLIWTVQWNGRVDIPVELGWITSTYLPQPPASVKTPLSTILRSVTETDEAKVEGEQ